MKQLIAMLPGSFYLLHAQPDYPVSELVADALGSKIAWAIAVLSLASYVLLIRARDSSSGASRGLLVTAVAFVLLPPALIAISARYQTELVWGNTHLPVYYEYFGLALLGTVVSARIFRGPRAAVLTIVAPISAVYVASNWIVNMRQVASLDATSAEPRNSFVSALKAGLLDSVEDGDIVAITNQPVFINGNLIYQTIGKNLSIPNEGAISHWFESKPRRSANHYNRKCLAFKHRRLSAHTLINTGIIIA